MGCCHSSTLETDFSMSNPPSSRTQREPMSDGVDNPSADDPQGSVENRIFKLSIPNTNNQQGSVLPTPTFGNQNRNPKPFKFEENQSSSELPLPDNTSEISVSSWNIDISPATSISKDF